MNMNERQTEQTSEIRGWEKKKIYKQKNER